MTNRILLLLLACLGLVSSGYSKSLTAIIQSNTTEERVGEQVVFWIDEEDAQSSEGVTFEWYFGLDATTYKLGKNYYVTYASAGTKTIEVVVRDDNDVTFLYKQINIIGAFRANFESSTTNAEIGEVVEFTITSSPQDNVVGELYYTFDFGDGAEPFGGFYDVGETIQVTYVTAGTKTISLEVSDDQTYGKTSKNITIVGGGGSTCFNGVWNVGETQADCGGICSSDCDELCSNGIQDGDETDVDFGGRCGTDIKLVIASADEVLLGEPIVFTPIIDNRGDVVLSVPITYSWDHGTGSIPRLSPTLKAIQVTPSNPIFYTGEVTYESAGDKVVSLFLSVNGKDYTTTKTISVVRPTPTCDDGKRNGDEIGIDCGGPCQSCRNFCNDGILNGNEFNEADCFGSCDPCGVNLIENGDFSNHDCAAFFDKRGVMSLNDANCLYKWNKSHGHPSLYDYYGNNSFPVPIRPVSGMSPPFLRLSSNRKSILPVARDESGTTFTVSEPYSEGIFYTLDRPLDPRRKYILSFDWFIPSSTANSWSFYANLASGLETGKKMPTEISDQFVYPERDFDRGTYTNPFKWSALSTQRLPLIDNVTYKPVLQSTSREAMALSGKFTTTFIPSNDRMDQLWFYLQVSSATIGSLEIVIDNISLISIANPDFHCPSHEVHNSRESVLNGTLSVTNKITLLDHVKLESSDDLRFKSGAVIHMKPGVEIPKGAKTHFYIAPCQYFKFNADDIIFDPSDFNMSRLGYELAIPSEVFESEIQDGFYTYPNPTAGELTIVSNEAEITEISVFNASGVRVYHKSNGSQQHKIDLSLFPNGIYLIRATNSNGVNFEKRISLSQ